MKSIGLYIGRFQPFHLGHKSVVDNMIGENDINIILIGISSDKEKNPYNYNTRLHFFIHTYSNSKNIFFYPLLDDPSDIKWIESILNFSEISASDSINIYAGDLTHDSAIKTIRKYKSMFQNKNLNFIEISRNYIPMSGTHIREKILSGGIMSIKNDVPGEVYEYLTGE